MALISLLNSRFPTPGTLFKVSQGIICFIGPAGFSLVRFWKKSGLSFIPLLASVSRDEVQSCKCFNLNLI